VALVVFLKGINVGGHRTLRPAVLAAQLQHLDVVNIGAAGTFVVRQPVSHSQLRSEIARRLPFDAEIAIFKGGQIIGLMSHGVFARHQARPGVVRFVSVLPRLPKLSPVLPTQLPSRGQWLVKVLARDGRFVFGLYRRHMKTIGCLRMLDRLFGTPVTTRNWNTIAAIVKVLERAPAGHQSGEEYGN
jgi:uncharacterized protein (DUF1697 family)